MSEELLKELLEETKKQNKIQEEIKREVELQNDLKMYDMLRDKISYDPNRTEMYINEITKGRLYARLSDEDRSILERFKEPIDKHSDERQMYNMTTRGPSYHDDIQEIISDMHLEILNDVYTERELYDYFSRVFERAGYTQSFLNGCWEKEWQAHKEYLDDEEDSELKRKDEKKYENRITKNMTENE